MPHLFLDLDNTLVGTEDLVLPVFLELLKQDYNLTITEDDFYALFLGKAGKDLYRAISHHYTLTLDEDDLLKKQMSANHRAIVEKGFPVAQGMVETLNALHAQGWMMTIVSNSSEDKIRLTLDHINHPQGQSVKTMVEHRIVSCNDKQKPDPDGYLRALNLVNPVPGDAVFCVEDSPSGAAPGVAAGLPVLGYTGFARHKNVAANGLFSAGCRALFGHWADLSEMLTSQMKTAHP